LLVKYREASFALGIPTEERNPVKCLYHGECFHAKTIMYQTRLRRWRV